MLWLLEPDTLRRLQYAQEHFCDPAAVLRWEAEQQQQPAPPVEARDGLPQGMTVSGETATISVTGVLTKRPDFWAKFFGGGNTTYSSIRNALGAAANSPDITEIVFAIDSPGGSADGLIELLDSIAHLRQSSEKKMRVRGENAQSAAYGIAAAVGSIEATGRGATFGSIGTAVAYYVNPNVVELTNTDSPDKRPNLATAEGKAVVIRYLDQVNHEFVTAIAHGRGVALAQVSDGYGRGASMTATEAKRLGLIDTIATHAPRAVHSSSNKGHHSMAERDQETESRAALDAATQRGALQERDRVVAHLTMGESCGDLSIALDAIRSGAGMTQELTARYLSAGMCRSDRQRRQAESNTAETQLAGVGAASPVTTSDLGDQVVAVLKQQGGERSFIRG